jgi:hypothetical protein
MKSPFRYLTENSTKFLCQPQDSDNFSFLDLLCFSSICASFGGDLVTVSHFNLSRTLRVTNSHFRQVEYGVWPIVVAQSFNDLRGASIE